MTAPAPARRPPAPPVEPPKTRFLARLPTMRVACAKCRHTSPALVNVGELVEVVLDCRCSIPEIVMVLGFPGKDLPVPLEPIRRDG